MTKTLTPKQLRNRAIAAWAREEGLPTNGAEWLLTKEAFAAYEDTLAHRPPAVVVKATKTKVVFDPRSTEVGPRGGDPVKRLRTILATEISGVEWGPAHREAWNTLEGWTLEDLATELGIKA